MNQRLLIDSLRRNWGALLVKSGLAAVIWIAAGGELISTGTAIAASMSLAMFAGFVGSLQLVAPREVLILPISRNAIWRTRFWFGTFVVSAAIAAGKLVALPLSTLWSQPAPGLEAIGVSTVLDLISAPMMALLLAAGPITTTLMVAVGLPLILLGPFVPLAIANRLPVAWNQFTPLSLALIAAGIAMGWVSYLRTPHMVTTLSPTANRAAVKTKGRGWLPEFSGVTGLRRLLLKAWATSLTIQIGSLITMLVIFPLLNLVTGDVAGGGWRDSAREFGLLPFESASRSPSWIMAWIFASVGSDAAARMVRHLRTLPISSGSLTAILMSASLVAWTNAWFVFAAFHVIATGNPLQTWRLPMFATVLGVDSLYRALQLRWRRPAWIFSAAIVVVVPVAFIVTRLLISAEVLFGATGFATFCAAVLVN